jgi:hypothetical protein
MLFRSSNDTLVDTSFLQHATLWGPEDDDSDDQDDENDDYDFDVSEDDLHEIRAGDDIGEPDPEEGDQLPLDDDEDE